MTTTHTSRDDLPAGLGARLKLRWNLLMRGILHLWVRTRVLPTELDETGIDPNVPSCYVLDMYALSSVLILDKASEGVGLPCPLLPIEGIDGPEPRAYAALRRMKGLLLRRPEPRRASPMLRELVRRACEDPDFDIQLIPATVLVGRAPDKETGLAKILFTEDWEVAGRLSRLLSTLINGRHTFVQYSKPISLRELVDEGLGEARSLRKLSRILRTHFRRVRTAAIGPDLSHRRTVVDGVLQSPPVHEAITVKAQRDNISVEKAYSIAEKYAYEIAADYNYSFVRIASLALTWIWNRIYDGVEAENLDRIREHATDHEVIYVPCHRSHMDYLLLSYLLYHNGFVPPHVAAGVNLNLPIVGRFLRMGGAFYLRRTFRAQKLYSAVFNEYLSTIQARGTSIEYFIEGTRSRTGRLLPPKAGMLSMSIRAYLRNPERPIMFVPVYFGYERLVEGAEYTRELSGGKKKTETVGGLFSSWRILKETYGKVHVSFGDPILLDESLEAQDPEWRQTTEESGDRPPWLSGLVDDLGTRIMTTINQAADVNPVNLLATVLLSTSRHSMDEVDMRNQIDLVRQLLVDGPFGEDITVTDMAAPDIIELGIEMHRLERRQHALGDIIDLPDERAVLLTYFRNNATHLMAVPSLIACCFLHNRRFSREDLLRIGIAVYSFLKPELFLPWDRQAFVEALERNVELLISAGLLAECEQPGVLERTEGGTKQAQQIRWLALGLMQTLERYYIVIAVLSKNGSGTLSRQELERLCTLTAQRVAMLHEFDAPEFHDRTLIRQFISQLRQTGVVSTNDDGRLEFGEMVDQLASDAKNILSKEIRHAIIQVAPQAWETAREQPPS